MFQIFLNILEDPEGTAAGNQDEDEGRDDMVEGDREENDDDDDESDDDVQITIRDISNSAAPATGGYPTFNVKRGAPGSAPQGMGEKSKV